MSRGRRRILLIVSAVCILLSHAADATTAGADDPIESSTLLLHLDLPSTTLGPVLDRFYDGSAADRFGQQEWTPLGGGTGFMKYHATRRRSELGWDGNQMISRATIEFSMEYAKPTNGVLTKLADCGSGSTGKQAGRLGVSLSSLFSYQRDYRFGTSSQVTSVEALQPCFLGAERVNGAPLMAQVYRRRLESMLPLLDRNIRDAVSFKARMSEAWAKLQAPIQLDDQGTLWLLVAPLQTQSTEPAWTGGALSAEIGIVAAPRVVTGKKPTAPLRPLPELGGRYTEQGFHVLFDLDVPYDAANAQLRKALVGQDFGIGPGRLVVRRVRLYPLGEQAGVEIDVDGVITLGVKLRGTPVYDEAAGTIGFTHVEYDVAEQNVLTDLADQLLHETVRDQLAARLKIPIRDHLEEMRRELEAALNRDIDGGSLHGKVDRIRLIDLRTGSGALSARFRTDGKLRYHLR